jgi:hypothetical protein
MQARHRGIAVDVPVSEVPARSTWQRGVATAKTALLWMGGVLFLLTAGGHQLQYPESKAFIGLVIGGLALLPPSRAILSRLFSLTPSRTAMVVLLIGGMGLVMMGMDEGKKKDAEAQAKGYASNADLTRAQSLGFTSPADLAAHDTKVKAEAEAAALKAKAEADAAAAKAAAEAAEAKRKQDEQAERERVAAAEAERKKDADCKTDLQCWGDKHSIKASFACRPYVERLAKYQFEWTDGWLDTKFSRYRWKNKSKGQVTYVGDKIKFQNGFGAWQFATYTCDYDPVADVVLNVDATAGRLPE